MSLELTLNEPQINLGWVKSPDHLIYEFYNYRLDARHLMLYRGDEEVSLTPKQVETLLALVEKNGEIVSKDVLMTRLWGDTAVEEANLIQNIHFLRKELGNAPNGKPMIETLRRRGYRFATDLNISGNGKIVSKSKASAEAPPWYQQRPVAVAMAALGLLGMVIIASSFLFSSQSAPVGARTQFAVLPLKPIDASNRSDALVEIGVADLLIHRLNSIQGFVVRPLSATRKYDAVDQDALAAGREQKVDHVIASNYQLSDGKIRITAQLINVASGQVEDTFRVETAAGDIFALQDAVANEIAKRLITRFERTTVAAVARRGTTNEGAYRLYLQGRNLLMKRNFADTRKAEKYLEQAISLDPNFAPAYAQMAHAIRGTEPVKAKEFVNRALELDPNLAEAFVARADLTFDDWDFQSVEKDLAKAIELEPNNDTAHWLSALLSSSRGRIDDALAEIEAAHAIDPGAVMYMFHRGRILYYARRYDEALAQFRLAMDLDDRFVQPYGWAARVYEIKGDYATAYQFLLKREERSPRKDRLESFQKAYEAAGWMGARRHLADADTGLFDIARLHALHGEKDAAFEYLNKAVEKRQFMMTTVNVEPAFDSLRDDPRFGAVVKRVGLE